MRSKNVLCRGIALRLSAFAVFATVIAFAPTPSHAAFSAPQVLNSDAAIDTYSNRDQTMAAGTDGTWIAVWVGASPNPVDPQGNSSANNSVNEDLFFARSTDYGQTWSALSELKTNAASDYWDDIQPNINTDGQGNWMVVWRSRDPLGGATGLNDHILMTFSSDNGNTWSDPAPVNTDAATNHSSTDVTPTVRTDGHGHWITAWGRFDNGTGSWKAYAMTATSADSGAHWTAPQALQTLNSSGMDGVGNIRVATDRQGNWIASWAARTSSASDYDIYNARSTNNGATWTAPALLNTTGATDTGDEAGSSIATDGQGHWMAIWVSTPTSGGTFAAGNHVQYATSTNNGATWSAPGEINPHPSMDDGMGITFDGLGNWVVTFESQMLGGDYDLFYTTLKQGATTWSAPLPVNPWAATDSATDIAPILAGDGQGRWVLSWLSNYLPDTGTLGADMDILVSAWEPDANTQDSSTMILSAPQAVNSDAASDTDNESSPAVATDGKGAWVSVWVAPSPNPVDPRGEHAYANDGINEDIYFARSLDNGKTWSTMAPLKSNAAYDYYDDVQPAISTDGQGHWIVVWCSKDPLGGTIGFDDDILFVTSSDNGATWSAPAPVNADAASDPGGWITRMTTGVTTADDDYPAIASDGQGHWIVSWVRYDGRSGFWQTSAMTAASSNNGATWSAPLTLQSRVNDYYGLSGLQLSTDHLGRWISCWSSRAAASDYEITCAISTDNGASWSAPALLNNNAASDSTNDLAPTLANDGLGNWIAVWQANAALGGTLGSDVDLLYAASSDNGVTWTNPAPVNTDAYADNADDLTPQLICDGVGHWLVFWTAQKLGADNDVFYATLKQGDAAWSELHPLNPWAATDVVVTDWTPQAASDGQGNWIAVWSSNYDLATGNAHDFDILYTKGKPGIPIPESPVTLLGTPVAVNSDATTDTVDDGVPAIAAGANGTMLAVWVAPSFTNTVDPPANDPGSGNTTNDDLYYARSLDGGKTWSAMAELKTNAAADYYDDLEPSVATDGHGHWMVVWRSRDPLGGTIGFDADVLMTFSSDDGVTWSAPAPVNNDANNDPGGFGSYPADLVGDDCHPTVATDQLGRWMVTWIRYHSLDVGTGLWKTELMRAASSDNGSHWTTPAVMQTRAESSYIYSIGVPTLATDHRGNWIVSWASRTSSSAKFNLYYSMSADSGVTWSTPVSLTAGTNGDNTFPQIESNGQGGWLVVWQSTDTLGGTIGTDTDILYSLSSDNGRTWSAPAPVNTDAATDASGSDTFPRLTCDAAGNWIAAWATNKLGGDQDFLYAILNGDATAWTAPKPLNPWAASDSFLDGGNYRSLSLAKDTHGRWMAAWNSNYDMGGANAGHDQDIFLIACDQTPSSGPKLLVSPGTLSFRKGSGYEVNVITNSKPTTQSLTLTNLGRKPLILSSVRFTGPYAADYLLLTAPMLPMSFSPMSSRTFVVQFAPQETAMTWNMNTILEFTSNDPTPTLNVPIVGDAVPVELSRFDVE